jgi:hypothetical protein
MHQRFDHFEYGGPNTISRYSTGGSPPIKAGHREIPTHLETTCTRFNTSARRRTRPSAGPERSQLLQILPSLTVRQFFSISAYFSCCANIGGRLVFSRRQYFRRRQYFSMCQGFSIRQGFCMRQGFSMRHCFCMRQGFWMRNVFVCAKVLTYANVFVYIYWRLYFYVFSAFLFSMR